MDAIRKLLNNPLYAGLAGLVGGLILGLIFGWGIWPVKWVNSNPSELVFSEKAEYLRMAIQAYNNTGDPAQAQQRYQALGDDRAEVLKAVVADKQGLTNEQIQNFGVVALNEVPIAQATLAPGETAAEGATQAAPGAVTEPESGGGARSILPVLCGVTLLIAAGLVAIFFLRSRGLIGRRNVTAPRPAAASQAVSRQVPYPEYAEAAAEPPVAQFMASYRLGDDLFDDSFSIDSPAGEFMGECGVGISETIGVGDPKKVTAFEVWLFDKNDIQTVTKVLMSAHAYDDDSIRQRLAAKGEPALVSAGAETVLETQTLQLVARVVDMGYGEGPLPPESFFDRFVLELAVWTKP